MSREGGFFADLVSVLVQAGTEKIFGLIGDGNLEFVRAVADTANVAPGSRRLEYVKARHEAGAVSMADAFARLTGSLGVATVTQGPGFSNALTALITADRHRTPLLLVTGGLGDDQRRGHLQWLDQQGICEAAGIAVYRIEDAATAAETTRAAIEAAASGRTVVLILIPLLHGVRIPKPSPDWPPLHVTPSRAPSASDVSGIVGAIGGSLRPVVLAGAGAIAARESLLRLAERLDCPLMTTLQAKGLFAGHDHAIGVAGGFGTAAVKAIMAEADLVLAFGASLNRYTMDRGAAFAGAQIVSVDLGLEPDKRFARVDQEIRADSAVVATALLDHAGRPGAGLWWRDLARSQEARIPVSSGPLHPRTAVQMLNEILPRPRTVLVEGGNCAGWPCTYVEVDAPADFVFGMDFGAIGVVPGMAVGAALARPDSWTIAFIGDGGFMMGLAELDTAVRYRLPLIFVVLNDESLGIEALNLRRAGASSEPADYGGSAPLADVVKGIGARCLSLRTVADVEAAAGELTRKRGPWVLDVRIDGNVHPEWL